MLLPCAFWVNFTSNKMASKEVRLALKKAQLIKKQLEIVEKEKLISEVQMFPAIWDRTSSMYRSRDVVDDGWTEVAARMGSG